MKKMLLYAVSLFVALHGIAHLVGFVGSWPLAELPDMPYKTTLLAGHWEVGPRGMEVVALLWLVGALTFVISAGGLLLRTNWWRPFMLGTILFSSAIIALDWPYGIIGAEINAMLLLLVVVAHWFPRSVCVRR